MLHIINKGVEIKTTPIGILASSRPLIKEETLKRKWHVNDLYFDQLEEYYYDKVKRLFITPYFSA